jgi:tRNA threonylcarbamoyladenosine biosynthesis protein TsaB
MALILSIETATTVCSVALHMDGELLASKEIRQVNSHAAHITLFIEEITAGKLQELDAIAVSKGPGSYTGLRIGVSTVKGLCYALNKPMIAINTLEAMAHGMAGELKPGAGTLLCPMIDARRMEVYNTVFDNELNKVIDTAATIVDETSFASLLPHHKIIFAGDGAAKCREVISPPNAVFMDDFFPSALFMGKLAEQAFVKKKFEDVAYFEPFYLKDFVGTTPKKAVG